MYSTSRANEAGNFNAEASHLRHSLLSFRHTQMVHPMQHCDPVLTESGGIQKEAYWLGAPRVTLRDETEWVETVRAGWNVLVGAETARITAAARDFVPPETRPALYGDGQAAARIADYLVRGIST